MAALARKQAIRDQATWQAAMGRSRDLWPDDRLNRLIDHTVSEIHRNTRGKRAGYGWSGGKDSLALDYVCQLAGITECVLAISELEYPAFLQWVTDHMPDGLTVINCGLDLTWLRNHPEMLFPVGAHGPKWFKLVNHKGQERFFRSQKLDVIMLGRRRSDGNYCGPNAETDLYTNAKGITRYSPLAAWPHEAVFSLIQRENMSLPPCYSWPRGYQVGTGSWPARQWTVDQDHGWSEVWEIDRGVVRHAAQVLPAAADWMARQGHA